MVTNRKQKKKIKITVCVVLLIICIVLALLSGFNLYHIWLNEFNAQIKQLGFYKNDVKLLNQTWQMVVSTGVLIISVIGGFGSVAEIIAA